MRIGILVGNEFTKQVGNYKVAETALTNFQKAAFISAVAADTVSSSELNDFLFEVAYHLNLVREFSDFPIDEFELREIEHNEDFRALAAELEKQVGLRDEAYEQCQRAVQFYLSPAGLALQVGDQINRVADKMVETLEKLAENAEKYKPEDSAPILQIAEQWGLKNE